MAKKSSTISRFFKTKELPEWASLDLDRGEDYYIVDVNKAYPWWQRQLKGGKDKYWAEVYRRCSTTLLKDLHNNKDNMITVTLKDPDHTGDWKLDNLVGEDSLAAEGAANFRAYYELYKDRSK